MESKHNYQTFQDRISELVSSGAHIEDLCQFNVTLVLRILSSAEDQAASTTETNQHELSRLLRYRLAVLEAALRRVDELHNARQPRLCSIIHAIDRRSD